MLLFVCFFYRFHVIMLGVVARSKLYPVGMQAVPSLIPTFFRFGHEIMSTAILPFLLIQEEQLSATGERMDIKCW